MKKLKIVFILTIVIVLTILMGSKLHIRAATNYHAWGEYYFDGHESYGNNAVYYSFGIDALTNHTNVYCVAKGRHAGDGYSYLKVAKARVVGDDVYFKKYKNGYSYGSEIKGNSCKENRILGAILFSDEETGFGRGEGDYNPGQKALYDFWAVWINKSGASSYGFLSVGGNGYSYPTKYENIAETTSYNYTIYFLRPYSRNVPYGFTDSVNQNMIVAYLDSETPIDPPKTEITVIKKWVNDTEADRPANGVAFNLYNSKGEHIASMRLPRDGTVNGNEWTGKFTNLSASETYTITERDEGTLNAYDASEGDKNGNTWTFTNTLQNTSITVKKVWIDDENRDGKRPSSVIVRLYEDGNPTNTTATLNGPKWEWTFNNLPKYKNGNFIKYTVKEETEPTGYTATEANSSNGYTITNTHIPEKISVNVKKVWEDYYDGTNDGVDNGIYDFDELRPNSIKVTLKANGQKVTKDASEKTITNPITLSGTSNEWTGAFSNLYKYENGQEITYTVEETGVPSEYTGTGPGNAKNGYTITNTHVPYYEGYKEIKGRVWVDGAPGKGKAMDGKFDQNADTVLEGITVRLKYIDSKGNSQDFDPDNLGRYETKTDANGEYSIKINYDISQNVYKLYEDPTTDTYKNSLAEKLATAYVEFEYDGMLYTTINYNGTESKAKEDETRRSEIDGNNDDTDVKYNTVNSKTPVLEREENEKGITTKLIPINDANGYWNWDNRKITANTQKIVSLENAEFEKAENQQKSTEILKYCSGNGQTQRTDPTGAWKTIKTGTCNNCTGEKENLLTFDINKEVIENVNCALFEKEQPDVAIFSDISKVEVEMNGQKYTYLYGIRNTNPDTAEKLKVKFETKDTYTYKRPVNPADIAYIKDEVNKTAMNVYVTYAITVGNLSNKLTIVVDSIANDYDPNYEIIYGDTNDPMERYHITYGTMDNRGNITGTSLQNSQISTSTESDYKEVILSGLGIKVTGQKEAENKIFIRYQIDQTKLPELFNDNTPPLNNATEILSYKTIYGEETVYAEQRKNKGENQPYAGYDFDSHPGNANIKLMTGGDGVKRLYSTDAKGNLIPTDKMEDDTDIAPSFLLCLDGPTSVSGIVWEDSDKYKIDNKRLGNGKIDSVENKVKNVKIELYEADGSKAKIYDETTGKLENDAETWSDTNGAYELKGLVTGKEYFIKYTYGNDTEKATTMDEGGSSVNARNYKSTIITEEYMKKIIRGYLTDKEWPLKHEAGYSVAVDNMLERLKIPDLQYSNFNTPQNMTAYTKPFIIPLEMTLETSGDSDRTGKVTDSNNNELGNTLNNLDFGISERPRENLYAQKTITHIRSKIT